ncbi:hypothetical protein NT6N_00070 [Oceaniferula spumae]|uniref:Uncharacterized protein n=1 Tax=Oceaniferula spumae TaxID=2979115 RepID=A0AAT9FGD8_9BACT
MTGHSSILGICILFAVGYNFASAQGPVDNHKRPLIADADPYKKSDILVDNGTHTILPKRCILFIPEKLQAHLIPSPKKNFTIWPKFLRANSQWLYCFEVTLDQAKGLKPIDEKKLERVKKLGKIVVAVRHKNPISVLPVKKEPSQ